IEKYTLSNRRGARVGIMTLGGIVTELHLPTGNDGKTIDVVLGFDSLEKYVAGHPFFGSIIGRVAGRMTGDRFTLDGITHKVTPNDPPNHLHGGPGGFDKRVWHAEPLTDANGVSSLNLSYLTPEGEEGYPGEVSARVTYTLTENNGLIVDQKATTTEATPLSMTHHSYFNLAGAGNGSVENHTLQIEADSFMPTDEVMTLSGVPAPVRGQPNDLTSPQRLGDVFPHLWKQHGDLYKIRRSSSHDLEFVARVTSPESGLTMEVFTTDRWIQLYSGVSLDGSLIGKQGKPYSRYGAFCLECEGYPDGANRPDIDGIILRPGQTYEETTVYRFGTIDSRF
ncbi:MAG: aldose epimerase family protein, partial [Verrucomicrobiae bacterium]|nr:aldose epimerase family protein [Verrucomicrobiae bacterium]